MAAYSSTYAKWYYYLPEGASDVATSELTDEYTADEITVMDFDGDDKVTSDEWYDYFAALNQFETISEGEDNFDIEQGLAGGLSQWFLEFLDADRDGTITWADWVRSTVAENEFDVILGEYGAEPILTFEAENTFDDWSTWYDTSNDARIDWEEYYAGLTDKAEWLRINDESEFDKS